MFRTILLATAVAAPWLAAGPAPGLAQSVVETPEDIIAAQIRRQGFTCDKPASATRDREQSKPGEAAWVLKCETETYHVKLIPNLAAKVEPVATAETQR
ncbi:MAG: hypothetical protein ACLFPA_10165 [Dichotomicrobium sp.]